MASGGKISATKLSFTLPISCQICLEKVKEPVTCPNQHVFCSLCMEVWLERNKQCPTCRVDITPQSPVRRIIGGQQSQGEEIRSPRTSKQLRRARMELLFRDYENEIAELQREVECLKLSNDDLKQRLAEEEQKNFSSTSVTKSKCSRCGNMKDIDSMLEMAKNLQRATRTFGEMKQENAELKQTNEKLLKDFDDLRRQNISVKEELGMRSPMKFGRLTVATLQSRIEAYEKEILQMKKAMEKSDLYTEGLQEQLNNCTCGAKEKQKEDPIIISEVAVDQFNLSKDNVVFLSGHDYSKTADMATGPVGTDVADGVTTYTIENILSDDLVTQAFTASLNENSIDQSLFAGEQANLKSPFTPATKLSRLTLATPKIGTSQTFQQHPISIDDLQIQNIPTTDPHVLNLYEQPSEVTAPPVKEQDTIPRNFTAQMMPPVESPDYKEKLQQIQGNLLHPITTAPSQTSGQVRSFSRRLTFDETLLCASNPDFTDSKFFDDNTQSSCSEEAFMLIPNEDSIQSLELDQSSQRFDESKFARPHSVLQEATINAVNELNESSNNPILSSGSYEINECSRNNGRSQLRREVSLSVVEAGGSRITTTKLSQSDRDVFTRPSSAPSRTFLLSGSKFSALRPLDPGPDCTELSQFQPVKCKSPSPLSVKKLQSNFQVRSPITPKKEGIRCVVDGRASSPMLRLVSPDEVIGGNWKPMTCHSRSNSSNDASHPAVTQKSKDTISRVTILKRSATGKPSSHSMNIELACSPPVPEDCASSSRRSSRKQCLNDPAAKRVGDHSLEFVSPVKSPKMESRWKWSQ